MPEPDPERDLVVDRTVDVPPSFVWDAWTRPELLRRWFAPKPWETVEAELDPVPGGIFRTVMRGPDGTQFDNAGCFLEIVTGRKLTWTSALEPGYRPQAPNPANPFFMTATITIEPTPTGGTRYVATVLHADVAGRARHEAMGFQHGWNAALDQLVALASV